MVGIVIFTLLVCITTATCVLGCKYLDKQGDLSYSKFKELNQKLDNLEKMLNDNGHGGRANESSILVFDNCCCLLLMACDFLHLYSFRRYSPENDEENF